MEIKKIFVSQKASLERVTSTTGTIPTTIITIRGTLRERRSRRREKNARAKITRENAAAVRHRTRLGGPRTSSRTHLFFFEVLEVEGRATAITTTTTVVMVTVAGNKRVSRAGGVGTALEAAGALENEQKNGRVDDPGAALRVHGINRQIGRSSSCRSKTYSRPDKSVVGKTLIISMSCVYYGV